MGNEVRQRRLVWIYFDRCNAAPSCFSNRFVNVWETGSCPDGEYNIEATVELNVISGSRCVGQKFSEQNDVRSHYSCALPTARRDREVGVVLHA